MSQGPAGPVGPQGPRGIMGQQGVGIQGVEGPRGIQGREGNPGRPGANGAPGKNGTNGIDGKIGLRGPRGFRGFIGPKGPIGDDGMVGRAGTEGLVGPQGDQGEMGPMINIPWAIVTFDTYGLGSPHMNPWITGQTFSADNTSSYPLLVQNTFVSQNRFRQRLTLDQANAVVFVQNAVALFEVQLVPKTSNGSASSHTVPKREVVVHPPNSPNINVAILLQSVFDSAKYDVVYMKKPRESLHFTMSSTGWTLTRFPTIEAIANVPPKIDLNVLFSCKAEINANAGGNIDLSSFFAERSNFLTVDGYRASKGILANPLPNTNQSTELNAFSLNGLMRYPNVSNTFTFSSEGVVKTISKTLYYKKIQFTGPAFTLPVGARRFSLFVKENVVQSQSDLDNEALPVFPDRTKLAIFVLAPTLLPGEVQTLFYNYEPKNGFFEYNKDDPNNSNRTPPFGESNGSALMIQIGGNAYFLLADQVANKLRLPVSPENVLAASYWGNGNDGTYATPAGGPYQYVPTADVLNSDYYVNYVGYYNITCVGIQFTGSMGSFPTIVVFDATGMDQTTEDFVAPTP